MEINRQNVQNGSIRSKQINAILFDMDNTLIQTRKADLKACNKVMINVIFVICIH